VTFEVKPLSASFLANFRCIPLECGLFPSDSPPKESATVKEFPRPAVTDEAITGFLAAGRIAGDARKLGVSLIQPGVRLEAVLLEVETFIRDQGGSPAFPAQTSRNQIAAHYCSKPNDPMVYEPEDLVKIDIGVEVDGWVADNAATVYLGESAHGKKLVQASQDALAAAIAVAAPGVQIRELSRAIENAITAHGLKPVYNLTGHGVGRWLVHTAPQIPATPDREGKATLQPGMVIAIEPFATDGRGQVYEQGKAEIFALVRKPHKFKNIDERVWNLIEKMQGLPFARRTFCDLPTGAVEATLLRLKRTGCLIDFPPLVDPDPSVRISQAEHTLMILENEVVVTTRDVC